MNLDEKLSGVRSVAISGHVRPDGDCVGSCLSIYNYILEYFPEIDAHVYLEPIPNIYKFMENSDRIEQVDKDDIKAFDPFICVDCHDTGRLGDSGRVLKKAAHCFVIDHHIGKCTITDDYYIYPDASSACELISELMPMEKITKAIAECIYTGIMTDTGVFQYKSTAPKTMRVAAELMEKGIDFSRIVERTFFEKTYNQNRIMGHAILKSKLHANGRIVTSYITAKEMEEFGVAAKHMEGIVNQLGNTKGVDVSIFFYQTDPDGSFKASTRASADCSINLAEICASFGGGGHEKAAGFQMKKDPEEAIRLSVAAVEKKLLELG